MADYTIQRGDTLSRLASQWGTSVQDIMKANPYITDPNKIYAGKTLARPGTQATSAPAPSTSAPTTTTAPKQAAPAAATTTQTPPNPIADYKPSQFPYEAQMQELLKQMPQYQPKPQEEMLSLAQQYAALQVDPQKRMLEEREQERARQDMASAVSRGVARGGGLDRLNEQRYQEYDPRYQELEAQRGMLTAQQLANLEAQQHARGMEGWQGLLNAMQNLSGQAQAWDESQFGRALDVHDRTMLTPLQQLQTHLGYTEALGEIPPWMIDQYGGRASASAGGGTTEAPAGGGSYTIQRGDTLGRLAKEWGTTVDAIMKANPYIKDPNLIYVGKSLTRP